MKIEIMGFEFEGKTVTELDLDLEALTGRDLLDAEREANAMLGRPSTDLDKTYQVCVAAKAAKVVPDMILAMPAKYFAKVTSAVQSFLFGA